MTWYLAPSLAVLRAEINARWPGRDKTSDGTVGDLAHQSTNSDHNPNERGSVDAADFDEDGIDPYVVIGAFQRHPSAHYWIYERQIADRDDGWRRRTYTGTNPHDKHAHFSIRQSATAEQNTQPWGLLEDDMTPDEMLAAQIRNPVTGELATVAEFFQSINREAYTARLTAQAALAKVAGDLVDEPAIVAGVLAGLTPEKIAAAIPPTMAKQVADELARRLVAE